MDAGNYEIDSTLYWREIFSYIIYSCKKVVKSNYGLLYILKLHNIKRMRRLGVRVPCGAPIST